MQIKHLPLLLCWLFLAAGTLSVSAQTKIHLTVPDYPPYTSVENGRAAGAGVDIMKSLLTEISVDFVLSTAPNHGRAFQQLKNGASDGFFMASRHPERDAYAEFSRPILPNRWGWFVLKEKSGDMDVRSPRFKRNRSVGTMPNTNQHDWLRQQDYRWITAADTPEQLVQQLELRRIEAVFTAEHVFLGATDTPSKFRFLPEKRWDLGLYVSKDYLKRNPDFLTRLNAAIDRRIVPEN